MISLGDYHVSVSLGLAYKIMRATTGTRWETEIPVTFSVDDAKRAIGRDMSVAWNTDAESIDVKCDVPAGADELLTGKIKIDPSRCNPEKLVEVDTVRGYIDNELVVVGERQDESYMLFMLRQQAYTEEKHIRAYGGLLLCLTGSIPLILTDVERAQVCETEEIPEEPDWFAEDRVPYDVIDAQEESALAPTEHHDFPLG